MKLSVIIPCYNEDKTIGTVLKKVINNNYKNKEIIVIDDFSTDNSKNVIKKYENNKIFKLIFNKKNKGKGFCVRSGFDIATGDICLIQDADLEYDPSEHVKVIKPILDGNADVVYGSRFSGYGVSKSVYRLHKFGNFIITSLCNLFTKLKLTDVETCFKAFKAEKLKLITLKENRFGFEPEITIKLAKKNCKFYEVGINYYGRNFLEGKKISWKDGIRAIYCILKYTFFD